MLIEYVEFSDVLGTKLSLFARMCVAIPFVCEGEEQSKIETLHLKKWRHKRAYLCDNDVNHVVQVCNSNVEGHTRDSSLQ